MDPAYWPAWIKPTLHDEVITPHAGDFAARRERRRVSPGQGFPRLSLIGPADRPVTDTQVIRTAKRRQVVGLHSGDAWTERTQAAEILAESGEGVCEKLILGSHRRIDGQGSDTRREN